MKKLISICIVALMVISVSTSWTFALDEASIKDATVAVNPLQMAVLKFSLKQKGLSDIDIAKEILKDTGISETLINTFPEEKLLKIFNSRKIETKETYVRIAENGETIKSTKAAYETEIAEQSQISAMGMEESSPTQNSWAKLTTSIMQSVNDKTEYIYLAGCEWLASPFWRMNDYIAIAATEGSVIPDSALAVMSYAKVNYTTGATSTEYIEYSGQSQITSFGRLAYCSFNLPDNRTGTSNGQPTGIAYQNFDAVIFIEARQINASVSLPFNVSSAYFHQKLAAVFGVSVSAGPDGLSGNISISPSISFSKIFNSMSFVHNV